MTIVRDTYNGNPTQRSRILEFVTDQTFGRDAWVTAKYISKQLGIRPSTVSSHLTTFRKEGVVKSIQTKNGTELKHTAIRTSRPGHPRRVIETKKPTATEGGPAKHTKNILDGVISAMAELEQKVQKLEAENEAYKRAIDLIKGIVGQPMSK